MQKHRFYSGHSVIEIGNTFFPSISYYFHIPKIFDYLEFHCPKLDTLGIDKKVVCYHNISNLLWKKDVLCVWKEKWISKTFLAASNLQKIFSIQFSFLTLEQIFSTVSQKIMVTDYFFVYSYFFQWIQYWILVF